MLVFRLLHLHKFLIVFYSLTFFFSILARIFFSLEQTTIITIIYKILVGVMISMIFNIIINNLIRLWVRFRETIYGDESYLTHTLPVTKNDIYNSKFLLSLITLLSSFLVIILSLFIVYGSKENINYLLDMISNIFGNNSILFILSLLLILFIELLSMLLFGYLGIILGNRKNNRKTFFSILFAFISYMISQLFILFIMFIIGLFNSNIMNLFISNEVDINSIKLLIIVSLIIYVTIIIVVGFISKLIFNKGVNVD